MRGVDGSVVANGRADRHGDQTGAMAIPPSWAPVDLTHLGHVRCATSREQ